MSKRTDDDSSTVWGPASSQAVLTSALAEQAMPQQYTLTCGGGAPATHPGMWRLEGSQVATTWQVLDSADEEAFAFPFQLRSFVVAHPQPCRLLRLVVAAASPAAQLELAEVELLVASSP